MYLAMCISHPNCCSPPRLSCLYGLGYGLGSIPTIGTCAQRAPGPTAAQCYTSIVVLQSCISLFKPTCIGNISQSGVVIQFRPRALLLWFCHHFCFILVTFCATLMWCKLIEFKMILGFNIFAFPSASCFSLSPFSNRALPQRFRNRTHGKRRGNMFVSQPPSTQPPPPSLTLTLTLEQRASERVASGPELRTVAPRTVPTMQILRNVRRDCKHTFDTICTSQRLQILSTLSFWTGDHCAKLLHTHFTHGCTGHCGLL